MLHKDYQVLKKIVLFAVVDYYEKSIVFFGTVVTNFV